MNLLFRTILALLFGILGFAYLYEAKEINDKNKQFSSVSLKETSAEVKGVQEIATLEGTKFSLPFLSKPRYRGRVDYESTFGTTIANLLIPDTLVKNGENHFSAQIEYEERNPLNLRFKGFQRSPIDPFCIGIVLLLIAAFHLWKMRRAD